MVSHSISTTSTPVQSPLSAISERTSAADEFEASHLTSPVLLWIMRLLCTTAMGISGYLAWTAFNMSEVLGCSGGQIIDCGHVLNSKWSKVLGISVSVPAFAMYAGMLAALCFMGRLRVGTAVSDHSTFAARVAAAGPIESSGWSLLTVGSIAAGAAAFWFVGLQVFVLEHLCPYCLVVHTCGLIMAGIVLWKRAFSMRRMSCFAGTGIVAILGMAAMQTMTEPPPTYEVIRYDAPSAVPTGSDANQSIGDADGQFFAAPGEVFDAPGEFLAAPGEIFAAPGELIEPPGQTERTGVEPSKSAESVPDSDSEATDQPSVASTLLLILPARGLLLDRLLLSPAVTTAAPDDPAVAARGNDEKTVTATDEKAENADERAAADEQKPAEPNALGGEQPAPPQPAAPPEPRLVSVAGNKFSLNADHWPLLGKSDARYIFVEMFDYTCPHCRNTHRAIEGAFKKYGDDLAIVALPVPLESRCNPAAGGGGHAGACDIATTAVAVWRIEPGKFREFHCWLFEGSRTRSATEARQKAEQLVGKDKLTAELKRPTSGEFIKRHVALYQRVGAGSIPKLMFPQSTTVGEVNSATTLCSTIERELKTAP